MLATLPRRSVLGSLASAALAPAALGIPIAAAPDPMFAAIAAAIEADDALTAALIGLDENDDVAMGAANAAADRSSDAIKALATIVPTTAAGLHALIRHYAADCTTQDAYSVGAVCLEHLARCIRPPAPD